MQLELAPRAPEMERLRTCPTACTAFLNHRTERWRMSHCHNPNTLVLAPLSCNHPLTTVVAVSTALSPYTAFAPATAF